MLLRTLLDVADNSSTAAMSKVSRTKGIDEISCKWIDYIVKERSVYTTIIGEALMVQIQKVSLQGRILSPLVEPTRGRFTGKTVLWKIQQGSAK